MFGRVAVQLRTSWRRILARNFPAPRAATGTWTSNHTRWHRTMGPEGACRSNPLLLLAGAKRAPVAAYCGLNRQMRIKGYCGLNRLIRIKGRGRPRSGNPSSDLGAPKSLPHALQVCWQAIVSIAFAHRCKESSGGAPLIAGWSAKFGSKVEAASLRKPFHLRIAWRSHLKEEGLTEQVAATDLGALSATRQQPERAALPLTKWRIRGPANLL